LKPRADSRKETVGPELWASTAEILSAIPQQINQVGSANTALVRPARSAGRGSSILSSPSESGSESFSRNTLRLSRLSTLILSTPAGTPNSKGERRVLVRGRRLRQSPRHCLRCGHWQIRAHVGRIRQQADGRRQLLATPSIFSDPDPQQFSVVTPSASPKPAPCTWPIGNTGASMRRIPAQTPAASSPVRERGTGGILGVPRGIRTRKFE
jgi:hypothetical protein